MKACRMCEFEYLAKCLGINIHLFHLPRGSLFFHYHCEKSQRTVREFELSHCTVGVCVCVCECALMQFSDLKLPLKPN